jgi:hypothetical protein
MPTYLVESYVPNTGSSAAATVAALLRSRAGARYRWSLFLPDEENGLHMIDGASAEVVLEATVRAALRCQRINQVVLLVAEHLDAQGGSP